MPFGPLRCSRPGLHVRRGGKCRLPACCFPSDGYSPSNQAPHPVTGNRVALAFCCSCLDYSGRETPSLTPPLRLAAPIKPTDCGSLIYTVTPGPCVGDVAWHYCHGHNSCCCRAYADIEPAMCQNTSRTLWHFRCRYGAVVGRFAPSATRYAQVTRERRASPR
jgi:hypothetical protein